MYFDPRSPDVISWRVAFSDNILLRCYSGSRTLNEQTVSPVVCLERPKHRSGTLKSFVSSLNKSFSFAQQSSERFKLENAVRRGQKAPAHLLHTWSPRSILSLMVMIGSGDTVGFNDTWRVR